MSVSPKKTVFWMVLLFLGVIIFAPLLGLLYSVLSLKIDQYLLDWLGTMEVLYLSWRTFVMAAGAAVVSLMIGVPAGLALAGRKGRRSSWVFLVFLPLAVPPYLGASCWAALLGFGREGAFFMSSLVLGISYFPIVVYLVISGMASMGRHYEEAASLILPDYKVVWKIILPLLQPHIITGFLLVFLLAGTNYAVPALLGYKTLTTKIYTYFALFQNLGGAVFLALPLILAAFIVTILLERYMDGKSFFSLAAGGSGSTISLLSSRKFCWLALAPAILASSTPVIFMVYKTGSFAALVISYQQVRGVLFSTVSLALFGTLFLTIPAYITGYFFERSRFFGNQLVRSCLLFSFALPSILLAVGLILVWNRPVLHRVYDSPLVLMLLWGVKFMPLSIRIAADHMKQIPVQFEEAAHLGGLRWLPMMQNIIWPLSKSGFIAVWGVCYIFAIAELGGTLMVIPPGFDTIPLQLYNMMHYGASSLVAGTGIIILLIAVFPLIFFYIYGRGGEVHD